MLSALVTVAVYPVLVGRVTTIAQSLEPGVKDVA
jgi:hypothetical protein